MGIIMNISESIVKEFQFFLLSFFYGIGIFFIYDCIRIIRRIIKHFKWLVGLEDIAFWVFIGVIVFELMYKENSGIIRGFVIVGMITGMVFYLYLISKHLVNGTTKLIKKIISFFKKIIGFLLKPFCWAGRRLSWIIVFFRKKLGRLVKNCLKPLKKCWKTVKITVTRK